MFLWLETKLSPSFLQQREARPDYTQNILFPTFLESQRCCQHLQITNSRKLILLLVKVFADSQRYTIQAHIPLISAVLCIWQTPLDWLLKSSNSSLDKGQTLVYQTSCQNHSEKNWHWNFLSLSRLNFQVDANNAKKDKHHSQEQEDISLTSMGSHGKATECWSWVRSKCHKVSKSIPGSTSSAKRAGKSLVLSVFWRTI